MSTQKMIFSSICVVSITCLLIFIKDFNLTQSFIIWIFIIILIFNSGRDDFDDESIGEK